MNLSEHVRVRFAPSPTGHLHIGGLRTALFNWLFARHHGGTFLLRIEDTDKERSTKEFESSIINSLSWCGLVSDEPVVIQSARINEHQRVCQQLIEQKKAYRCYCVTESYQEPEASEAQDYSFTCVCALREQGAAEDEQKPYAVRFKIPANQGDIVFNDLIRGQITIARDQLHDFILMRSTGVPTYNFVVVLDDVYMNITHVIRGEEHISNTPKQLLLYEACGYTVPQFAHLPMILGPSGGKLSKREGAVGVHEYRAQGYLADALINFLVRLGWAHGDQEVFTKEELIRFFSLEHIQKKGAIFDIQKLQWINGVYIRQTSDEQLYSLMKQERLLAPQAVTLLGEQQVVQLIRLYKERAKNLRDIADAIQALAYDPQVYDAAGVTRWVTGATGDHIRALMELLDAQESWNAHELALVFKTASEQRNIGLALLAQPVRLALTGVSTSPGVYELMAILGQQKSSERIKNFMHYLTKKYERSS